MGILMLSGVHGVGKGYFIQKVSSILGDYRVCTASELIHEERKASDAGYKRVSNVKLNQEILISKLNELNAVDNNCLLDGHLCVLNSAGKVERVPEDFFCRAKIQGIVILQDFSKEIVERIVRRDNKKIEYDLVEYMQKEEEKYAVELAVKYNIKFKIITHKCDCKSFRKILNELGGNDYE